MGPPRRKTDTSPVRLAPSPSCLKSIQETPSGFLEPSSWARRVRKISSHSAAGTQARLVNSTRVPRTRA